MAAVPFTEEDLHELYMWVDEIPISRPKRSIARDFADGCCVAEIVKFFFPKIVDLHNYVPAMSMSKKRDNWRTLNAKVFRKLYFEVPAEEVEDIVCAVPGAIERFLRALRIKVSQIKAQREEMLSNQIGWNQMDNAAGEHESGPIDAYHSNGNNNNNNSGGGNRASSAGVNRGPPSQLYTRGSHGSEPLGVLAEKDRTIMELQETVGILSEKIMKLEELVRVKDEKLNQYRAKFGKA